MNSALFFHAMILNIIQGIQLDAVNSASKRSEIELQFLHNIGFKKVKMIPEGVIQSLKKLELSKYNQSSI